MSDPALRQRGRLRALLQTVHLWIGLVLGVPLLLLGVTGSILVFEHELADIAAPQRSDAAAPLPSPSALIGAAERAAPEGWSPVLLRLPAEPGAPATVRFVRKGGALGGARGGFFEVSLDPATLEVLARGEAGAGLLRQIFLLHANLLTPDRTGRAIIGWFGVAMLVLAVSGLVLWWPRSGRWRAALTVRWSARGFRFHRDLHGAVGFWILAVLVVVSASGVYLAFPQTVGGAVSAALPARDLRGAPALPPSAASASPSRLDADRAVAAASVAFPEGRLASLGLPRRSGDLYRVGLMLPGAEPGAPLASVFVEPAEIRVVEVRDPRRYSLGETILAWQHALHAGHGLGPVWKALIFLSGLAPMLFAITGTAMWILKRRARRAGAPGRAIAAAQQS